MLAPDILSEVRELSSAVLLAALVVGLLLWCLGGLFYRFWVVLATTLAAGVVGLQAGPAYGVQPLVAGLLSAVAAGAMALALIRVVAFAAGGFAGWLVFRAIVPNWDDPLLTFLIGGLIGLVLFRFWILLLTSLLGTLLAGYSGLALAGKLGNLDVTAWAQTEAAPVNWAFGAAVVLGVLTQFFLDRRRLLRQRKKEQKEQERKCREEERRKAVPPKPWWSLGSTRRAG